MKKNVLSLPFLIVGLIWAVFLVDFILPVDLRAFGIIPRSVSSLPGILFSNFIHANIFHLIGNTLPLFFLLLFLTIFYRTKVVDTMVIIVLVGGSLLWIVGRPSIHIGASMLIYGLASFLILYGLLIKKFIPVVLSLVVILMYGSVLLVGVLPIHTHISWEGHLFGGVGGVVAAWLMKKMG